MTRSIPMSGLLLAMTLSVPSEGQELATARTLWASDPAEVPAFARDVDALLSAGQLAVVRRQSDGTFSGRVHERMNQYHGGVRVFGGQVVWQREGGRVLTVTGGLFDGVDVETTPALSPEEASSRALARAEAGARAVGPVELVILPLRDRFVLAYFLHVRGRGTLDAVFVDAHTGAVALTYDDHRSQTAVGLGVGTWADEKKMSVVPFGGGHRAVDELRPFGIRTYDVGFDFESWNFYQADQDRFLAVDADNEWRDGAVVDAHAFAGWVYDYYFRRHGRRGLDDHSLSAINFVHILPEAARFNNAFYDPVDNSMNYGDGDGERFAAFSSALDVVAHELTHGVTRFSSDLIYLNEPGALNESISDIMAVAVEFMFEPRGNGRQRADWILGEDLFIHRDGLFRSFADPRSVGDPDHWDVRCRPAECPPDFDNGGVHINSSIANHAFYLMVEGGTNRTSGATVRGVGFENIERIESIFYRAFFFYLVPSSNFSAAREATLRAARELFGEGSVEESTVRAGWDAVGVR